MTKTFSGTASLAILFAGLLSAADPWLAFPGIGGPGKGKHVVLVSGDEEYRSEEALPQLAKILSTHHGFRCTVLFAIDPHDGTIDPNQSDHIPGLQTLNDADVMILATRFRDLPDEQMNHIIGYIESGRPIIGLRTATHAFQFKKNRTYQRYSWNSKDPDGGFGRLVLGETWIAHHGQHGKQSTRGILVTAQKNHPILRGVGDGEIWGPTDVYKVRLPLPGDSQPLVLGQVLVGMASSDPPVTGPQNEPMMPIAWTRTFTGSRGKTARVFTSTMGASQDFQSEAFRRLIVNAVYWAVGMEAKIPENSTVDLVGEYNPTPFGFNGFRRGVKPDDLRLPAKRHPED